MWRDGFLTVAFGDELGGAGLSPYNVTVHSGQHPVRDATARSYAADPFLLVGDAVTLDRAGSFTTYADRRTVGNQLVEIGRRGRRPRRRRRATACPGWTP